MSLNCTLFCVCQNLYSVFLFWFLGEMYLQIPAYLFPLACSSTDREQRRKIIKNQPDPSCWKGGAHHTIVRFHRLMFRALLWNHQQLKCHQVPRCSAPKLQPLSSPGIKFLVPAQRNPLHFVLSTRTGRMELFPHHHSPLFTNRPPCPHFQWSILSCSLPALPAAVPSPSISCPQEKLPWKLLPYLWGSHVCGEAHRHLWGPGCQLQWVFWIKSSCCSRTNGALFQWGTGCAGWMRTAWELGSAAAHGCDPRGHCCHCCKMPLFSSAAPQRHGYTAAMEQSSSGSSGSHSPVTSAHLGQNCSPRTSHRHKIPPINCLAFPGFWER